MCMPTLRSIRATQTLDMPDKKRGQHETIICVCWNDIHHILQGLMMIAARIIATADWWLILKIPAMIVTKRNETIYWNLTYNINTQINNEWFCCDPSNKMQRFFLSRVDY